MVALDRNHVLTMLRRLAKIRDDGFPVVSLYLDTSWDEERKRDAARVFVKSKLQTALSVYGASNAQGESLRQDVEAIRRKVEDLIAPTSDHRGRGFAVFASASRSLWETVSVPRPFENSVIVRQVPYLIPLARLVDDYQTAFVCQVDSRAARILEIVFGGLAAQETIDHPDVPGRHHQGGWSQMRYQRRIDWAREQHVKEVAEAFVRLADQDTTAKLFLSGPPEPLGELRAALPKRIATRSPVELGLDLNAELPVVLSAVLEQVESMERAEETSRVRTTLEAALSGHLAAAGPGDVVAAANQGAVSLLIVEHGQRITGWRCERGCIMGSGPRPRECPVCGGAASDCDLAARLVESVLANGGDVDIVHSVDELAAAGGVAARLRFSV